MRARLDLSSSGLVPNGIVFVNSLDMNNSPGLTIGTGMGKAIAYAPGLERADPGDDTPHYGKLPDYHATAYTTVDGTTVHVHAYATPLVAGHCPGIMAIVSYADIGTVGYTKVDGSFFAVALEKLVNTVPGVGTSANDKALAENAQLASGLHLFESGTFGFGDFAKIPVKTPVVSATGRRRSTAPSSAAPPSAVAKSSRGHEPRAAAKSAAGTATGTVVNSEVENAKLEKKRAALENKRKKIRAR